MTATTLQQAGSEVVDNSSVDAPLKKGNPIVPDALQDNAFSPSAYDNVFVRAGKVCEVLRQMPIIKEAFTLLEERLPKRLAYHGVLHTETVMHSVVALALHEGLSEEEIKLLAIAAAWHDVGYIEQDTQNEPIAADMVRIAMKRQGFSIPEIDLVTRAILDTQVHFVVNLGTIEQRSSAYHSNFLLDADLSSLGRPDFAQWSLRLFAERTGVMLNNLYELNMTDDSKAFLISTHLLLKNHRWFTGAARQLFSQQEQLNIDHVEAALEKWKITLQ